MTTEPTPHPTIASQFEEFDVRRRLRAGEKNTVYEVAVDGRRAAWKVTDGSPARLAREAAVVDAVDRTTPVPTPSVIATGEGWLVLEWAPGDPGSPDPDDRSRERLHAVGRTLARLHRATTGRFDGHGTVAPNTRVGNRNGRAGTTDRDALAVADPGPWPERLGGFVEEWTDRLTGTSDADIGGAVREFLADHRPAFADCHPVLVHGEPAPEHVHFEDRAVAAVIDWELAQAAPGEFDLVWAERDFLRPPFEGVRADGVDPALQRALLRGYEAERPLPAGSPVRRAFYRAAFAARTLGLVEETATYAGTTGRALRRSLRTFAFEWLDTAETRA